MSTAQVHRYAREIVVVDPGVDADTADWPPLLCPQQVYLDGTLLEDVRVEHVDPAVPLTVTLAVPRSQVRMVVTESMPDGTPLRARVWVDNIEVCVPVDPVCYPDPDRRDTAWVDVHVAQLVFRGDRTIT